MNPLQRLLDFMTDLVGVRTCAVCGDELLPGEKGICVRCMTSLPRPSSSHLASHYADVFANAVAPQGITESWFDYNPTSPYAQMILQAKYHNTPRLARELGHAFGLELLHRRGSLQADVLLPVPMHWRKRMKRGYNQSIEIARGLSEATGISVGDNLVALRSHETQTHKGDQARRANIRGTIGVEAPHELNGLRVAIVDDIITTGSTIAECAAAISLSGARPQNLGFITLGATVLRK